jgi:aspartate racemase
VQQIGIVACSSEGAALCYRTICAGGANLLGSHRHPPVSLHTPCFEDYMELLRRDDWNGVAELMLDSANKLAATGAEFLICPDNTIHQAMPQVVGRSPLPWLHIAEIVAGEAQRRGFARLGILGTRWLVEGDVYPEKLAPRGLDYARPAPAERDEIDRIIFDELVYGVFEERSIAYVRTVIERMQQAGCDAVILGCTELPLIIDDRNSALPPLDSTRLLAWEALERATGRRATPPAQPRSV